MWTMDMIRGSAGNFYAHFVKNVDLYVQGDLCKTQIMGTPCTSLRKICR